jgi:hypothetical protein
VHLIAFHARARLRDGHVRQFPDQTLEDAAPDFRMRAFTLSPSSRKRSMCFFLNW